MRLYPFKKHPDFLQDEDCGPRFSLPLHPRDWDRKCSASVECLSPASPATAPAGAPMVPSPSPASHALHGVASCVLGGWTCEGSHLLSPHPPGKPTSSFSPHSPWPQMSTHEASAISRIPEARGWSLEIGTSQGILTPAI